MAPAAVVGTSWGRCGLWRQLSPCFADPKVIISEHRNHPSFHSTSQNKPDPSSQALRTPRYHSRSSYTTHKHTMASRAMSMPARRLAASLSTPAMTRRSFSHSAPMLEVPAGAMPVRKPVGAFRGGYETYRHLSAFGCTANRRRVT